MVSGVTHGFVFPYGWWLGPSYTSSMAWSIVHWQAWPTIAYHLCSSMLGRVLLHFDSRKWKHMATTEAVFSEMSGGFWSLQFWRRTRILNIDRHMYERSTVSSLVWACFFLWQLHKLLEQFTATSVSFWFFFGVKEDDYGWVFGSWNEVVHHHLTL